MTTTLDIQNYLVANSPWIDLKTTVDTVKIGDPVRPVRKAGVCWMPAMENIQAAHAAGCDLLVVHEPTFWEHAAPEQQWRNRSPGDVKRRFLEETGMVVLRAHDCWDNWPEIGIRDSWARGLGLVQRVREGSSLRWHAMYEIPPQSLREFAQYVANRIQSLGEESVQVIGNPERIVSRPSLGVGCCGPDAEMVELGSDVLIVCYDGAAYWATRQRLTEMNVAVITVEHGTSEMWGMENLCSHLSEVFSDLEFEYFAEQARPWTVLAENE